MHNRNKNVKQFKMTKCNMAAILTYMHQNGKFYFNAVHVMTSGML